jgi:DNA-binding IclR family transcriptional regulator
VTAYIEQGRRRQAPYTVESADRVWENVRHSRQVGYSIDDEEDSVGVRCLGAAVRGAGANPIFAISVTGPSPRFTRDVCQRLIPTLLAVTRQLSQRFGWDAEPDVLASETAAHGAA